jgi:transcriptional antiterminator RfaH
MSMESTWDVPQWYVVQTHPKQEDRADSNLKAWKIQTFYPKVRQRRYNEFTGAPTYLTRPLFPRYLFARFKINDLYHKIRFTRGVHSLVSFSGHPTPVDGLIIEIIESSIADDGFVRLGEIFKPGDEVVIKEGPLRAFKGVFERDMQDSERVRILLQTVDYQAHLVIDREQVMKLASAGIGA